MIGVKPYSLAACSAGRRLISDPRADEKRHADCNIQLLLRVSKHFVNILKEIYIYYFMYYMTYRTTIQWFEKKKNVFYLVVRFTAPKSKSMQGFSIIGERLKISFTGSLLDLY